MNRLQSERKDERLRTFWDFLCYLEQYVNTVRQLSPADTDAARTRLVSMLTEHMRPVLRAQVAFVGYRDVQGDMSDWVSIVQESIDVREEDFLDSRLFWILDTLEWRLPYGQLAALPRGRSVLLFDEGLGKCPDVFLGLVTALAMSRVVLSGREYFMFFCDVEKRPPDGYPTYDDFDGTMLTVAAGILEGGFRSGLRRGQDLEEARVRKSLRELVHELKIPIQAVLADASNLVVEIPEGMEELRAMASRNVQAARDLGRLIDDMRIVLFEYRFPAEPLVERSLSEPLTAAIEIVAGEAQGRGLRIPEPESEDGRPFPTWSLYFRGLTTAFKNVIHNAVVYSLPLEDEYRPISIVGRWLDEEHYEVAISNHGIGITQAEINESLIFGYKYRGERARELNASGAGLGLASVQQIVDNHLGQITVTSRPVTSRVFHNVFRIALPKTIAHGKEAVP